MRRIFAGSKNLHLIVTLHSAFCTLHLYSKWGSHHAFLLICLNGTHAEQRNYAKSFGMTLDELADNINEIAVNLIGDIVLDFDGDKYTVIPDYIDVIEEKNI